MRKVILAIILLPLLACGDLNAQQPAGRNYFRSPVGSDISLSGTFGEIRRNHFHSGIDIRTGGVQGKPVYAVADGYVSRIFVSPSGFGKAIYINHPNGCTSVYGHLKSFSGVIGNWVKKQQYRKESFALDTTVPAGILKVKKGELIALSGNSGASGGPHLHFEIRDSKTQDVLDPLSFGLPHHDVTPPRISWVKIYPHEGRGMINFSGKALLLPVTGSNGTFTLKIPDTLKVTGDIIFGIETSDYNNSSTMRGGVQSVVLLVDDDPVYSHTIDRFAFGETRYVNSLIDYPAFMTNQRKIQRSYVAPNNHISIYGDVINRGVVHFSDNKLHRVTYRVSDLYGNRATLSFAVQSHPPPPMGGRPEPAPMPKGTLMSWRQENVFERADVKFIVPGAALYEDLDFLYSSSPPLSGSFSRVHELHNRYAPLHTWCDLYIRPAGLPEKLRSKAVVVKVDPGNKFSAKGGEWVNGMLKVRIRELGKYTIRVDTVAPVIKPVNIFSGKKVSRQYSIQVKISDNLSGIKRYRGTLNGQWILMDFDEKNGLLLYAFDERLKPGKNIFKLVVTDNAGNSTSYNAILQR